MSKKKQIKLTLVKSLIGRIPKHRATVRGLGLSKMHQSVFLEDTASVRGMVAKVQYLLKIEDN